MKARILFLMGSLVLAACKEPQVSSDEPTAAPTPSPAVVYLARRVAIATEESLYGLEAGTELNLIEERPASLLVEAEGMQFEIEPEIEAMDAQLEALREAQCASVDERSDHAIWCKQALKHRINLRARKHHRHVWAPLGSYNPSIFPNSRRKTRR
jgi:hypothetical protein